MATTTDSLDAIRAAVSSAAEKVYAEPIRQDDLTVIPAACVGGGGGAGGGRTPDKPDTGMGDGGGFGLKAKPAGVFVIKQGRVRWRPAVDINRVILGAQVVAVTALLAVRAIVVSRGRPAQEKAKALSRLTNPLRHPAFGGHQFR